MPKHSDNSSVWKDSQSYPLNYDKLCQNDKNIYNFIIRKHAEQITVSVLKKKFIKYVTVKRKSIFPQNGLKIIFVAVSVCHTIGQFPSVMEAEAYMSTVDRCTLLVSCHLHQRLRIYKDGVLVLL